MPVNDPRVRAAKGRHADKNMPVADICQTKRISRPTLYRYLAMKQPASGRPIQGPATGEMPR